MEIIVAVALADWLPMRTSIHKVMGLNPDQANI